MSRKFPVHATNFSAGEVSDFVDARPDVGRRYNGALTVENCWILPEGGVTRRPGTMYGGEVEDSTKFHRLITFEYSVEDAFALIFGDETIRFIKNRAPIMDGPSPYEIVSPYDSDDLRDLHREQSADYMFLTSLRTNLDIQKLIRIADDDWTISNFAANPPPSFEADIDYSGGTITLTPGATTGAAVTFTASAVVFLPGDVGRQIIFGASRAIITAVDVGLAEVTANIIDAFPNTNPIAAGSWFLRGTPDGTFDPDRKEPVGTLTTCTLSLDAIRSSDAGRFVKVYSGVLKIITVSAADNITCEIMSALDTVDANPAAAPAGSWRLEEAAWSTTRGFPRTVCINGGRLVFGGWPANPTAFAGSSIDDVFNFAVGSIADDAYEYTIQGGQQNSIQWLVSHLALYIGDAKREYSAKGRGVDAPLGGDEIPHVVPINFAGSRHVQPIVVDNALVFVQRFGQDIVILSYSLEQSSDATALIGTEPNLFSRHIGEMIFANHAPAYAAKPFSIIFFPLENGQLANFTFKPRQEVSAFSRTKTRAGDEIESVCVVPHEDGKRLTVLQICKRTINGGTKRYWEWYEDDATALQTRITDGKKWAGLHTDCAKAGSLSANATEITGLAHLATETVDVIIGDSYIGEKVVSAGGVVTLEGAEIPGADTVYEVGLHYDSTLKPMTPALPGEVTEGLKRKVPVAVCRLKNTIGGSINGVPLKKQPGGARMFTGRTINENLETADPYDGALTIVQSQPYPFTLLNCAYKVAFAEDML